MEEKEVIKEINQHISDALEQWSNVVLEADANNWAYFLEYSDKDLANALFIFNHVVANFAIKSGVLTEENVTEKISAFRNSLKDTFGFDSQELIKNILFENEMHKRGLVN